nr:C587 [uncultured bacterium]
MKRLTILLLSFYLGIAAPAEGQIVHSSARKAIPLSRRQFGRSTPILVPQFSISRAKRDVFSGVLGVGSGVTEAASLSQLSQPAGNWGGSGCPPSAHLKSLVDSYIASASPDFPGLGSTVPGLSLSWSSPICGTFTYAAGLRNIEKDKPITPATLMGIASMTKPIIAAITLQLSDSGVFGPNGLDTTVNQLLTTEQITALTVGTDPLEPKCPDFTYLFNRDTFTYELKAFSCPDLSQVTLRHLLRANHGMYDFINEVLLPDGSAQYDNGLFFNLYQFLGLSPSPPLSSKNGFDYLKAYGLKQNQSAEIGGNNGRDFEVSFGNTGFQLLGIILEQRTGKSLDELIRKIIVDPLKIDPMYLYVEKAKRESLIADGYDVYTGEPLIELTGVYPIVNLNGHTALNTLSLGLGQPGNVNLAGGAGGLIANPKSYRIFFDAFVNGGLLSPAAQSELVQSFVEIPDLSFPEQSLSNGFGILKVQLREVPGLPSVDILTHGGALPGVRCENAVLRLPDSNTILATGVICQNSAFGASDPFHLELAFINAIASMNGGQ